jgi:TatD DNase family protein
VYRNGNVLQSEDCPGLIDTHCHLDLEPLFSDLDGTVSRAIKAGVSRYVVPGVHPAGWERMAGLSERYQGIYPAYGIHPMHATSVNDSSMSQLGLVASHGVAVGEIGLDPTYDVSMEQQEKAFRQQLRLAVSLGLPVLIHCRRAFQRTLTILQEEHAKRMGGIMHAFSGSLEMAREFIRLGFLISVSGVVTRESAVRVLRVVRELPLECLVLETDAPDLTPQRYQGEPNQPAYLLETLQTVALLKGVAPQVVAESSRAASLRALGKIEVS